MNRRARMKSAPPIPHASAGVISMERSNEGPAQSADTAARASIPVSFSAIVDARAAGNDCLRLTITIPVSELEQLSINAERFTPSARRSDDSVALRCLRHLYAAETEFLRAGSFMTVGQIISESVDSGCDKKLRPLGLRLSKSSAGTSLAIANHSAALESFFSGTPWSNGAWIQAMHLLGAVSFSKPVRFGPGLQARAHAIPPIYWPGELTA